MAEAVENMEELFMDDVFEGLFEAETPEIDVAPLQDVPVAGDKVERMKEELKDVNEKHKDTIAQEAAAGMAEEAEEDKKKADKFAIGNMKIRKDRQGVDIIHAEQRPPYHNDFHQPKMHDILPSEIYSISVRRYYIDLELMPAGKRTMTRENIWVLHHGYYRYTEITRAQLEELLAKKMVKPSIINYVFSDCVTGLSVFLKKDVEPGPKEIEEAIATFKRTQNLGMTSPEGMEEEEE